MTISFDGARPILISCLLGLIKWDCLCVFVFVLTSIEGNGSGARTVLVLAWPGGPPPVRGFPQLLQNTDCALLTVPQEGQMVGERDMVPPPLTAKQVA